MGNSERLPINHRVSHLYDFSTDFIRVPTGVECVYCKETIVGGIQEAVRHIAKCQEWPVFVETGSRITNAGYTPLGKKMKYSEYLKLKG